MNNTYELPPMLTGTAEQQLAQLRDYLVRLARELPRNEQIAQTAAQTAAAKTGRAAPAPAAPSGGELQLKALIVKTADRIYEAIDLIETALSSEYVAKSEFGEYRETVSAAIRQTARAVVESYGFQAQITALGESAAQLRTKLDGEIRRGFIPDPERAGEYVFGIAVAQKIVTDGTMRVNAADGLAYEGLDLGAMGALGLYTAAGWQFWIGGAKAGWFDAADGMLHVPQIVVETGLRVGADWLVTGAGGFGLRCMGG